MKSAALVSFLSLMTYGLAVTLTGPVITLMEADWAVGSARSGLVFSTLSAGFLAAMAAMRTFLKQNQPGAVIFLGQLAMGLGLGTVALGPGFGATLFGFFLLGSGGGLVQVSANSAVSHLYPNRRAFWLNILHLFFGIGAISGPLISGNLAPLNWRYGYIGVAVFSFLVAAGVLRAAFPAARPASESAEGPSPFRSPFTWLLALCVMLYIGIEMALNSWAVTWLVEKYSVSITAAGVAMSWFWAAMTLGRIACAWLSRWIHESVFFPVLSLASAVSLYIMLKAGNFPVSAGALVAVGFAFSGMFPHLLSLGSGRFPEAVQGITTILMTAMGIGFMTVPWLTGFVRERAGFDEALSILMALPLAMAAAGLIIRYLYRSSRERASRAS